MGKWRGTPLPKTVSRSSVFFQEPETWYLTAWCQRCMNLSVQPSRTAHEPALSWYRGRNTWYMHDAYGLHLDENIFKASEILAEIWSNTVIDGHGVDCRAVRLDKEFIPAEESALWISRHVQQSRYAIQVVKCFDDECCQPFETNWLSVFPDRFVPFPAVHKCRMKGIEAVEPAEYLKIGSSRSLL